MDDAAFDLPRSPRPGWSAIDGPREYRRLSSPATDPPAACLPPRASRPADTLCGVVRRSVLLLAIAFAVSAQAPALAGASDSSTTHAYIQANYALVQYAANRLGTARTLLEGVLNKVKADCPSAAVGSPQDAESTQVSNEIIGAMVVAAIHPALPEINVYLRVAGHSQWSSRALTRAVHAYAAQLRTMSTLAPPNLCGDIKAWAAGGFHSLPASTIQFDQRFEPSWVALGELPDQLKPFERPEQRSLLNRSNGFEAKITEFEAQAVETWGEIMNTLAVNP